MKKIFALLITVMAVWASGVDAQYTTGRVGDYSYTTSPRTNVITTPIVNFPHTSGTIDGQRHDPTATRVDDLDHNGGSYGSSRTSVLAAHVGSVSHDDGSARSSRFNKTITPRVRRHAYIAGRSGSTSIGSTPSIRSYLPPRR